MIDSAVARYLRAPDHPCKMRFVRWLGRTVIRREGILSRAHPNLRLMLHPDDFIELLLLRGEMYEPLTLQFLATNLAAGQSALLAGVNFGQHVAVASRAVGDEGLIVGVEPQPAALLRASRNLKLNNLQKPVRMVAAALGRGRGMAKMAWSDPGNRGAASMFDEGEGFHPPLLPVSEVVESFLPTGRMRLMLLDIQGYEMEVLLGLTPATRPELLVVELDPEFIGRSGIGAGILLDELRNQGYGVFDLSGQPATEGGYRELPEHNVIGVLPGAAVLWVK